MILLWQTYDLCGRLLENVVNRMHAWAYPSPTSLDFTWYGLQFRSSVQWDYTHDLLYDV